MGDILHIEVSIWDSGCLPGLLAKEIAAVEGYMRALESQLSPTDLGQHGAYLGQLQACLRAVARARAQSR